MQGDAQLFLGGSEVTFLKIDASQPAVQLRVTRCLRQSFLKGGDRIIPLLPRNLYVRTELERLERALLAGVQAIQFRESRIILYLLDEKMDESCPGFGIVGLEFEIIAVRAGSFGLFLSVQALRQSSARFKPIRPNFQRAPESCFGFVRLALTKGRPTQVIDGREIVGIQMEQSLEGFRGTRAITRAVLRDCQEIPGTALCRKQLNRFAKRRHSAGILPPVKKQHAEIEVCFGHFRVDSDGARVFGASFVRVLQRRISVSELKVRVSEFGLIGDDFLQRNNGRLEILVVDISLRFIKQLV